VETQSKRIDQLDGLRGIAILLVVLNHLRLTPLYTLLPESLQPVLGSLLNSGKIGVSILFLLTGFLMATIHPHVPSKLAFWQKRYTRIFPAFVSMCLALSLIRFFWTSLTPVTATAIVLGVTIFGGVLWKILLHLKHRAGIGKGLFFLFLGIQTLTILGYIFVLSRVSSAVFYLVWPKWLQSLIFLVVNSTVALPFGNYVPQLDGAYWSIVTEVLFYLFFPILFLPIVGFIVKKGSFLLGAASTIMTIPFFYGLSLLFSSILGFQVLEIYLAVYFAFGVALGLIYQSETIKRFQSKIERIPSLLLILFCLVIALGMPYFRQILSLPPRLDTLSWSLPLALLMLITIGKHNGWIRFLRFPPLMWIGRLSYALYLTHTIAIEMFVLKSGDPKTIETMIHVGLQAIGVMTLLSLVLHYFLEVPYFSRKIPSKATAKVATLDWTLKGYRKTMVLGTAAFLLLVWLGFRIPVALTSKVVNHVDRSIPPLSVITTKPITLDFTGQQPNLGMILFHIKPLTDSELKKLQVKRGGETEEALLVDVINEKGTKLTTNRYPLYQMYDAPFQPVGLPLDAQSEGKPLQARLYLSGPRVSQVIAFVNTDVTFRSVYFYDKKTLLTNPVLLISTLFDKATQSFMERGALIVLLFCGPLLVVLLLPLFFRKKKTSK